MATATLTPLVNYILAVGPAEPDVALLARFARSGDESAFAELVRRHGPAVLGTCRRILRDGHAAEDAFQATFLLLARKAGSLHQPERLASWLYGVTCRTAMKLRSRLCRQQTREHPFDETAFVPPDEPDADLGPELDAAIQQLPSKYRVPFVLCYLQGLTNAEAAARLGCPTNTVATRLSRARERLRFRLTKQGLTAAVSASLVVATARSAAALAAGSAGASVEVLYLMEGVRTAMMWKKVKLIVAAVAVVALTGFGAGRLAFRAGAESPDGAGQPTRSQPAIPPPVVVRSSTAPGDRIPALDVSGPEYRSVNFTVTGVSENVCAKIAATAEHHRKKLAKLWLGKELADWSKPCPVRVSITHGDSASATTFQFSKEFEIGGMSLSGPWEIILADMLPHEVTHTVLADYFRQPIPRWADEGAAVLGESKREHDRYEQFCRQVLNAGRGYRLQYLFERKDYPSDVMVLYAQGFSVTRFLVERKDRATFLEFVKAGMKDGWDTAAKRYYEFASTNDLEQAWLTSLRKPRPAAADATTVKHPPIAPPPAEALPPPTVIEPIPTEVPVPPPAQPIPVPPQAVESPAPTTPDAWPADVPVPSRPPAPTSYPQQPPAVQFEPTIVVQATMDKDGLVVCKFPKMTYYEPVTTYLRTRAGTSYIRKSMQEERSYRLDQLVATGTNGKPVNDKDVAKRLEKETAVLFVQRGAVDPQMLPLLKDGTLIITLGPSIPPPPMVALPTPVAPQ